MLRVPEITERDERRAAVRGIRGALTEWRTRDTRLTAIEHFIGLDVTALAVQVGAALYEVVGAARAEQRKTRRDTRCEYDALAHPLQDNDGFGAKLARH
jgi:hypothetical protein